MASVEAASALLTAESIVIAAIAISLRNLVERIEFHEGESLLISGLIATTMASLLASFVTAMVYLYVAEYPNTFLTGTMSPRTMFAIGVSALVILTYSGAFLVALLLARAKFPKSSSV